MTTKQPSNQATKQPSRIFALIFAGLFAVFAVMMGVSLGAMATREVQANVTITLVPATQSVPLGGTQSFTVSGTLGLPGGMGTPGQTRVAWRVGTFPTHAFIFNDGNLVPPHITQPLGHRTFPFTVQFDTAGVFYVRVRVEWRNDVNIPWGTQGATHTQFSNAARITVGAPVGNGPGTGNGNGNQTGTPPGTPGTPPGTPGTPPGGPGFTPLPNPAPGIALAIYNIVWPIMTVLVALGMLLAIYLGVKLATSTDEGKRREAKAQMIYAIIAIIIIGAGIGIFSAIVFA